MVPIISLRDLLEAGCHFGHHAERWDPKAKIFIYGEKNGVHIINLELTKQKLEEAGQVLLEAGKTGKSVIFVTTKKQARAILRDLASKYQLSTIIDRWPGGLLTNFSVVSKNLEKMEKLKKFISEATETKTRTKKEILMASRNLKKLEKIYGGIAGLKSLPDYLVLVDIKKEQKIVREAQVCDVKTLAIVDTNTNPNLVDYWVPANDDAVSSIKYVLSYLAQCFNEGRLLADKVEVTK